jgi:hypothetical protein
LNFKEVFVAMRATRKGAEVKGIPAKRSSNHIGPVRQSIRANLDATAFDVGIIARIPTEVKKQWKRE